jgi:O-antigen/teichoic acid export membrane protein
MKIFRPKGEFTVNVLTLMTGTTIAQALPIAISPILTRIYTPEDFGIYALYVSVVTLGAVISSLKYETSVMLPKKDSDAINLLTLSMAVTALISVFTLVLIVLLDEKIVGAIGKPEISNWLYFIPFGIFLTGIYQCFAAWSNRKKHYRLLSACAVTRSSTMVTVNLGAGALTTGTGGLIMGHLIGQMISSFIIIKKNTGHLVKNHKSIRLNKIIALAKKYKKIPLIMFPNALIDATRINGLILLIINYFSEAVLGQFSLAWKVTYTPMSIVGNSISQVFFQKMAHTEKYLLADLIRKLLTKAILISAPIYLALYFLAPHVFGFIFGRDWTLAGDIVSVLSPWLFLSFISSPLSNVFLILNRQEIIFPISLLYMLVPLIEVILFYDMGFLKMLSIISWSMCGLLIFLIMVVVYLANQHKRTEQIAN